MSAIDRFDCIPKFCMVLIFAVLIFAHLKQNIFYVVLICAHLIEKYNLIKRDNDKVNEEEEEENEEIVEFVFRHGWRA